MTENQERTVWIVSSEPASTNYGRDRSSMPKVSFRERVPLRELKYLVKEFADDLAEVFEPIGAIHSNFHVDSVEINAVMAADGKLGILGSSVGMKAEGGIKFVLKRITKNRAE